MKIKSILVFFHLFIFFFLPVSYSGRIAGFAEQDPVFFNWPRFRGPNGNGISECTKWNPSGINDDLTVLWKADIGAGYSNVTIKGKLLYTLGNRNREDTVYCIDCETGDVYWEFSYPCPTQGYYPGTRATPCFDMGRIYTVSREGHIFCINIITSAVIWEKHLVNDFHAPTPTWGFAGSPVIRGNILYINACRNGIALDKMTGKTIWKSPWGKCGYTTPVFCTLDKTDSVLFFSHDTLYSVEPLTGEILWKYPWETDHGANTTDPLVFNNHVLLSSSYGMGSACIRIKENKPTLIWTQDKMSSHFPNFIFQKGYIFGNDGTAGKGRYCCLDPWTGEILWSKSPGFGTLTATDKHLIFLTELGYLSVAEIDTVAYKEIARTRIKGGIFFTEPVLCEGLLYIRERKGMLYCFDVRKKEPQIHADGVEVFK